MLRCPVCRAENADGPQCRRCKADLALLFELEQQRSALLAEAAGALRVLRFPEARSLVKAARRLRQGEDAERLLTLCKLLQGEFAAAWQSYRR